MFFVLSKILHFLIMPSTWILALLIGAVVAKDKLKKKQFVVSALVLMLILTNPLLMNGCMKWWEIEPVPLEQVAGHDVGIVLTGVANLEKVPADRTYFDKGADRVYHALVLYKMGKIKKILITGGNLSFSRDSKDLNEADVLKTYFLISGVPEKDLILENRAKNTRENAVFTLETLKKQGLESKKLILITSAFHMRRAEACFTKVGLKPTIFPCDYYSKDKFSWAQMLPEPGKISTSGVIMHEMFGFLTYKVMGYI